MKLKQKTACLVAVTLFSSNPALAQSAPKISGDTVNLVGPGAVIAAKMAIADFSKDGTGINKKIELVSADHQKSRHYCKQSS